MKLERNWSTQKTLRWIERNENQIKRTKINLTEQEKLGPNFKNYKELEKTAIFFQVVKIYRLSIFTLFYS